MRVGSFTRASRTTVGGVLVALVVLAACSKSPRGEVDRERASGAGDKGIIVAVPNGWQRVYEPGLSASVMVLRPIKRDRERWPASATFSRVGEPRANPNRDQASCRAAAQNLAEVAGPGTVRSAHLRQARGGTTCWMLLVTERIERHVAFLEHERGWWMMDCSHDVRDARTLSAVCGTLFASAVPEE